MANQVTLQQFPYDSEKRIVGKLYKNKETSEVYIVTIFGFETGNYEYMGLVNLKDGNYFRCPAVGNANFRYYIEDKFEALNPGDYVQVKAL